MSFMILLHALSFVLDRLKRNRAILRVIIYSRESNSLMIHHDLEVSRQRQFVTLLLHVITPDGGIICYSVLDAGGRVEKPKFAVALSESRSRSNPFIISCAKFSFPPL